MYFKSTAYMIFTIKPDILKTSLNHNLNRYANKNFGTDYINRLIISDYNNANADTSNSIFEIKISLIQ